MGARHRDAVKIRLQARPEVSKPADDGASTTGVHHTTRGVWPISDVAFGACGILKAEFSVESPRRVIGAKSSLCESDIEEHERPNRDPVLVVEAENTLVGAVYNNSDSAEKRLKLSRVESTSTNDMAEYNLEAAQPAEDHTIGQPDQSVDNNDISTILEEFLAEHANVSPIEINTDDFDDMFGNCVEQEQQDVTPSLPSWDIIHSNIEVSVLGVCWGQMPAYTDGDEILESLQNDLNKQLFAQRELNTPDFSMEPTQGATVERTSTKMEEFLLAVQADCEISLRLEQIIEQERILFDQNSVPEREEGGVLDLTDDVLDWICCHGGSRRNGHYLEGRMAPPPSPAGTDPDTYDDANMEDIGQCLTDFINSSI